MRNDVIHIRVTDKLKASVEEILGDLGITLSYAVNMYLKQIEIKRGIPFEIVLPEEKRTISDAEMDVSALVNGMLSLTTLDRRPQMHIRH